MFENKKIIQLLASGLMAFLFIQFYLRSKEEGIELGFGMVNVLVAGQDIPPNHAITSDLVTTKTVAGRDVEPGAFRVKIPGDTLKRVIGKVTMSAIPASGQILQTNLRNASARDTGISPMLPPGKRGYVLRLGNLDVAKLILPGDHIDILATFTVGQKGTEATSKVTYTILQNIQVVAVDKDIIQAGRDVTGKAEITEGRLLTLAVSPVEAERLAHSQIESGGEISVVVRPSGDESSAPLPPVSASNLLQAPQPAGHTATIKNH